MISCSVPSGVSISNTITRCPAPSRLRPIRRTRGSRLVAFRLNIAIVCDPSISPSTARRLQQSYCRLLGWLLLIMRVQITLQYIAAHLRGRQLRWIYGTLVATVPRQAFDRPGPKDDRDLLDGVIIQLTPGSDKAIEMRPC